MPGHEKHNGESRDQRLKRVEKQSYERMRRDGVDPKRAKRMSSEAVEKGDQQRRDSGNW